MGSATKRVKLRETVLTVWIEHAPLLVLFLISLVVKFDCSACVRCPFNIRWSALATIGFQHFWQVMPRRFSLAHERCSWWVLEAFICWFVFYIPAQFTFLSRFILENWNYFLEKTTLTLHFLCFRIKFTNWGLFLGETYRQFLKILQNYPTANHF